MKNRLRIICIGNRLRGDDGAGWLVAEMLRKKYPESVVAVQSPAQLIDEITPETECLIIVDAVQNKGHPGRIHRLTLQEIAETKSTSTHLLSLTDAVELLRELGGFRGQITVYGIEGERFGYGEKVSESVEKASRKLADEIATIIEQQAFKHAGGGI